MDHNNNNNNKSFILSKLG
jgi:hypothetical protein